MSFITWNSTTSPASALLLPLRLASWDLSTRKRCQRWLEIPKQNGGLMGKYTVGIISPIRVEKVGEALQNHPALRNPSLQPHFFSPRFLLYQVSGCTKSNPGSDPHNWYCLTPIYWHGYMAQKTTVGFCRGSRVCPTEAIRNHAKKKQKNKKNTSNYVKTVQ